MKQDLNGVRTPEDVVRRYNFEDIPVLVESTKQISLEIKDKVDSDKIISAINLSPEGATINGDKISLEGKSIDLTGDDITISSNNFTVDKDGDMTCSNAIMNNATMNNATMNSAEIKNATIQALNENGINYSCYTGLNNEMGTEIQPGILELKNEAQSGGLEVAEPLIRLSWDFTSDYTTLGASGCYSPLFSQTSLEEKKKNFEKVDSTLSLIKNIDIYKYNLKSEQDGTKKHYGFVIGDNYKYSKELTDIDNKAVDLYSFVSVCCKAIQEQQEQIEELKKKVEK